MEIAVTVVIPAHNARNTLARALDSVMAQTSLPAEVIVVDDGSTDCTAAVARSYEVRGVKLLVLANRRGAAAARNAGTEIAISPWIAFLDADDEWLPSKLEEQIRVIHRDPEVAFVFCASHEISPTGQLLGDTFHGLKPTCNEAAWKALLARNFVATPTVIASRALLIRLGGFDEALAVGEDQDMWFRLALAGRLAYVPMSLVRVHVRPGSLSAWRLQDQQAYVLPMIERHLSRLGSRLTSAESRRILGERLCSIGGHACAYGDMRDGIAMIARSIRLGYRPLRGLRLLVQISVAATVRRAFQSLSPRRVAG